MADLRGVGKPITYEDDNPLTQWTDELRNVRYAQKREPRDQAERELLGRWMGFRGRWELEHIVAATQVAGFIIYEAALGFFGLGVPPPEPTWGNMLADARNYLRDAWWMGVCPGAGITLVALIANMLGEGLREMLNPE